jgi:STE24 endopeptidase
MEHVVAGPPGSKDQVQTWEQLSPQEKSPGNPPDDSQHFAIAKDYSRKKIILSLTGTVLFFALTLIFVLSGLSKNLDEEVHRFVSNNYLALLLFAAVVGIAEALLTAPLSFYSGFVLEHKYHLSNQTLFGWVWENLKGMMVSIPLAVPILLVFYYCLKTFGSLWWLPVGTILFFVTVVLARLGPVLIFPLFYKFIALEEGPMKQGILRLCAEVGVKVEGIFTFNLSKNTKKANAAFTGIGKSKRIILGDTLVQNFTDEEVVSVFAHELGHYTMRHIWVMMAIGTVTSFLGLSITALLYSVSLPWLGFTGAEQIGALPLLSLWLGLYSLITSPLSNVISRRHEFAADRYAVRMTGMKEPFINALRKLARINLADITPPRIVEFLFHSHPSIDHRIRAIEAGKS